MKSYMPLEERQARAIEVLYDALAEFSGDTQEVLESFCSGEMTSQSLDTEMLSLRLMASAALRSAKNLLENAWMKS